MLGPAQVERGMALVAEDHGVFRSAISAMLRRDCGFEHVWEVDSFDSAVQHLGDYSAISFATFDLQMPGIDRVGNLQSVRQIFPGVRIALVTASERREDMIAAIEAGVHGYIPKTLSQSELAAALNAILDGRIYLPWSVSRVPPAVERSMVLDVPSPASGSLVLTPRQNDVLRLIKAGKSNKEIAFALGLTENTVKVHTNALYKALGVRNRAGAASISLPG